MLSTKTVQTEINRLLLESKKNRHITSSEGAYYYTLCEVKNKDMLLEDFYKDYPYYNPDTNSTYWQQQHKRWKELWNEKN